MTEAEEVYSTVLQLQPDCQEATQGRGLVEIDRRKQEYEKVVKVNRRKQAMKQAIALALAEVEQQLPLQDAEEEILKQTTAHSPQESGRKKRIVRHCRTTAGHRSVSRSGLRQLSGGTPAGAERRS